MVVCRRHPPTDNTRSAADAPARSDAAAQGGPVFLPRRKISPLAWALLTGAPLPGDRSAVYDERLLGRPSV